jgi:ribosomal protein S18 acetylase RimI-like enzyme
VNHKIYQASRDDRTGLAPLLTRFRCELAALKGITSDPDIAAAQGEFDYYLGKGYPFYAAVEDGAYVGYLVCRVEDSTVWVESVYVEPRHRRTGIATELYLCAEELAVSHGQDTVYSFVHPNNDGMVQFLAKLQYDVLNLIEIRRPHAGEDPSGTIAVGGYTFRY